MIMSRVRDDASTHCHRQRIAWCTGSDEREKWQKITHARTCSLRGGSASVWILVAWKRSRDKEGLAVLGDPLPAPAGVAAKLTGGMLIKDCSLNPRGWLHGVSGAQWPQNPRSGSAHVGG